MSKKSQSQNSSDKEIDFLEEEFLKCDPKDLPVPKEEIKIYNYQVLEVMKTGCNRQIAEYVMLEYKKLEDEEKKEVLDVLRKNFFEKLASMLQENENNIDEQNGKYDSNEYDQEIDEYFFEKNIKDEDKNKAKRTLNKIIEEKAEDNKTKELMDDLIKYRRKRDAVIEACLRKVKKIVNDKEEYKKFFKGYYGKEYVEDEEESKK